NTAIVGGPVFQDKATIYVRSGLNWNQQQVITGSGAIGSANQGYSVALSGDGNTAIIGGPNDNGNTGAAWVFTRSGSVWTEQTKLVGTGVIVVSGTPS